MGTITPRKRANGSTGYTAQIRMKKVGKLVHREAQTFDHRQNHDPDDQRPDDAGLA